MIYHRAGNAAILGRTAHQKIDFRSVIAKNILDCFLPPILILAVGRSNQWGNEH